MLTAVLEARCGITLSGQRYFPECCRRAENIGTCRRFGCAAALISSVTGKPLPEASAFFGEVAPSAEVRQVAQPELRLKEASKLGFEKAFIPRPLKQLSQPKGLTSAHVSSLGELIEMLGNN